MKTKTVTFLILFLFLLPCIAFPQSKSAEVIIIDGVINPVVAEFTTKAIRRAASEGAECLIIQMDTPGGLDLSMRSIIKEML
ncbi:MAG: nodulation protein NfeD, partial [Deltaproteobacteria bacterium]|nr:nodulation protein NfeD [Deltaproteobacteria bacterium]